MNFPSSLLAWDVLVLNGYLAINCIAVFYVLYRLSLGKEYKMSYYQAPEEALEDGEEMNLWANKAYGVALRASAKKRKN